MSDTVKLLEKMGREAHWRFMSEKDMEQELIDIGIDTSIRSAIIIRDICEIYALLGHTKLIGIQTPAPSPHEVPQQPEPDETEEEGEDSEDSTPLLGAQLSAPITFYRRS